MNGFITRDKDGGGNQLITEFGGLGEMIFTIRAPNGQVSVTVNMKPYFMDLIRLLSESSIAKRHYGKTIKQIGEAMEDEQE